MAQNFIGCDREQELLLPPSLREWRKHPGPGVVGTVRVPVLVAESVMLAGIGDPLDHRALDRQRAEHGQGVANRAISLNRAVGEHPVKADRDP
jgi:hypothetical protein